MKDVSKKNWDIPTRLTHWALALGIVLNIFFLEDGGDGHKLWGYILFILVVFRFFWGIYSGNFQNRNPWTLIVYGVIWVVILMLGLTGYMLGLDAYWGSEDLESIHSNLSLFLQVLVVIHLCGIFLDSLRNKRKTWMSMITGKRWL